MILVCLICFWTQGLEHQTLVCMLVFSQGHPAPAERASRHRLWITCSSKQRVPKAIHKESLTLACTRDPSKRMGLLAHLPNTYTQNLTGDQNGETNKPPQEERKEMEIRNLIRSRVQNNGCKDCPNSRRKDMETMQAIKTDLAEIQTTLGPSRFDSVVRELA